MAAQSFEELEVWQLAHRMVLEVYRLSENFPKHELFGLTSQLRRAAVSVPANIAEGFKKRSVADKVRFYNIAQGSLEESATTSFSYATSAMATRKHCVYKPIPLPACSTPTHKPSSIALADSTADLPHSTFRL